MRGRRCGKARRVVLNVSFVRFHLSLRRVDGHARFCILVHPSVSLAGSQSPGCAVLLSSVIMKKQPLPLLLNSVALIGSLHGFNMKRVENQFPTHSAFGVTPS